MANDDDEGTASASAAAAQETVVESSTTVLGEGNPESSVGGADNIDTIPTANDASANVVAANVAVEEETNHVANNAVGNADTAAAGTADTGATTTTASNSPEGLSPYFATLFSRTTMNIISNSHPPRISSAHAADAAAAHAAAASSSCSNSAMMFDANNNDNNDYDESATITAASRRASMVSLLWNGVEGIVAAGESARGKDAIYGVGGGGSGGGGGGAMDSGSGGGHAGHAGVPPPPINNNNASEQAPQPQPPALNPRDAALYLCAVAKNVIALEEAVVRSGWSMGGGGMDNNGRMNGGIGSNFGGARGDAGNILSGAGMLGGNRGGGGMGMGMGGMGGDHGCGAMVMNQVADIARAVGIAATFCQSRNEITKSGILPALAQIMERTGTIMVPSTLGSSTAKASKKYKLGTNSGSGMQHASKKGGAGGAGGTNNNNNILHALTPFHPEFLQCCLLSSHYRYAQSYLHSHPVSHHTLMSHYHYFKIDPTLYLRFHYYAGMIHLGCNDWNAALNSFHLCMTIPCQSVHAISIAARKKSLLCQCLILEAEDLDGYAKSSGVVASAVGGVRGSSSGMAASLGSGGMSAGKEGVEGKVFDLPGAVSPVVRNYMTSPANRVGGGGGGGGGSGDSSQPGGGSAPESTASGGADTSEQQARGSGAAARRRNRSAAAASSASSSLDAVEEGGGQQSSMGNRQKSRNYLQLGRYHDLVSTYISGNSSHYATLLAEMSTLLHEDGNWGLARRLEGRLAYRAVRQVASVYSVVGIDSLEMKMQDLCSNLGSTGDEMRARAVEDALMGLSACDWDDPLVADPFVAKIDQLTGMVSFQDVDECGDEFNDDLDDLDEKWLEYDLSKRLDSCITLAERVRDLDIGLTTSQRYQLQTSKETMMRGDSSMRQGQGVADIGHGPMDIGMEWS